VYYYRTMTREQRAEVVRDRKARGSPWHGPPHYADNSGTYILSAACYEHKERMVTAARIGEFADAILEGLGTLGARIHAWVVLPNHYHVLADVEMSTCRSWIARLHNGKATQWNREDGRPGRKVWHRFSDRRIRNERHFYASLNYIHVNPVKHRYVARAEDWPWSSLHAYMEELGRETLVAWWKAYPVHDYGKGWDEFVVPAEGL